MRLIDADVTYKVITDYYHHRLEEQHRALKDALNRVPTVNTVRHGKWIKEPGMFMCSVCGDAWGEENEDWVMSFRYCPNCGAKIEDDTAPSEEAYDDFYAKHRD